MASIEEYFEKQEAAVRKDLLTLHRYLTGNLELDPRLRHSLPFYYGQSWICYLHVTGEGHIELGFTHGDQMSLSWPRLSMRDRKQVASVIFTPGEDMLTDDLEHTLQEAILLDEMKGRKSRQLKKQP